MAAEPQIIWRAVGCELTRSGLGLPTLAGDLKKSRARPASPRSRPTSPVNGAGGITGCRN